MARATRRRAPAARAIGPAAAPRARVDGVDALRGIAIVAMIAYHFVFDLRWFRVIDADFEHGMFWLTARALIVASFLLLVGISLVLAERGRLPAAHHYRRVALIGACAIAVSLASYALDRATYTYFGILHCIAVALLIARPLVTHPRRAAAAGVAIVVAGLVFSHPFFDGRATSWIGFSSVKPATQDFVPLFPWLGVVLIGIALGDVLHGRAFAPVASLAKAPRLLRALGRHSLFVYMIHQPLLIGAMWLLLRRG